MNQDPHQTDEAKIPPIRHQVFIAATPAMVYQAISTGAGWDAWFTKGTEVDATPGGRMHLRWDPSGPYPVSFEETATVRAVDPPRRFAFDWAKSHEAGPTRVTLDLSEAEGGTQLTLTDEGHPRTEAGMELWMDCAVGWGEAMTLLKFYLEHKLTYQSAPTAES